jgi:GDP-4-dehydro-6-deoxy-D-mannose reductase
VAGSFARQIAEIQAGIREPVIEAGNIDLRRDFTDVRDVARAYMLAADRGAPGEVYNIASGTAHTLRDMLRIMLRAAGTDAEIRQDDSLWREGEPPLLIGDATRLRTVTGWTPEVSFEQSAIDTLNYWRDRITWEG